MENSGGRIAVVAACRQSAAITMICLRLSAESRYAEADGTRIPNSTLATYRADSARRNFAKKETAKLIIYDQPQV